MASSVALEDLSFQSSRPFQGLKAFTIGSQDPHIIAASRISQRIPTHGQSGVLQGGTIGGLGGSLNPASACATSTPFSPHRPLLCPMSPPSCSSTFPAQFVLHCVPKHCLDQQRGVSGGSTGLQTGSLFARLLAGLQRPVKRLFLQQGV